ncbi:MAG: class B sortase [Clostridia bacterium]|nr:class B sortase [Clostridia bacterium]
MLIMLKEMLHALRDRLLRLRDDKRRYANAPTIIRKKRTHHHARFYVDTTRGPRQKYAHSAAICVLVCVFVYCAWQLGAYAVEYLQSRSASNALRDAYYEEMPEESPAATPTATPAPTPASTFTPQPGETPAPTATPMTELPKVKYPNNEFGLARSNFIKMRRQSPDIVGWLTIEDLIDEAVVKRNNEYYLDHDYRGHHNKNGAIFMEETTDLSTRPYTMILYGHNMKTGLMFGGLRNYENLSFYRANPFITFNSAYEDGRYVIFAVATIGVKTSNWKFVNLWQLSSTHVETRMSAIEQLRTRSLYRSGIEVAVDDQLLLLVTCVENDDERRVVAARRIREGEKEIDLQKLVNRAQTR